MEILPYIIRRRRCRSGCDDNDMPPFGVILTKKHHEEGIKHVVHYP